MIRVIRPNTYKAHMPPLSSEFYDFAGVEDEAAAGLLARHLLGLVHRARKTKLRSLTTHTNATPTLPAQAGTATKWLHKLLPGGSGGVAVYLPEDFVARLVRDVLRMTEGEKQGIRGCKLCVEVWDGGRRLALGKIVCDPKVTSTYLLYVRLVRGHPPASPPGLRLFSSACDAIYISPGYQLEKKRLS